MSQMHLRTRTLLAMSGFRSEEIRFAVRPETGDTEVPPGSAVC